MHVQSESVSVIHFRTQPSEQNFEAHCGITMLQDQTSVTFPSNNNHLKTSETI